MENMPATREKVIVGNNKKYTAYTRVTNNNSFFDTYIHKYFLKYKFVIQSLLHYDEICIY